MTRIPVTFDAEPNTEIPFNDATCTICGSGFKATCETIVCGSCSDVTRAAIVVHQDALWAAMVDAEAAPNLAAFTA